MSRRGLLLTMTEPPQGMEEEFNAWYDTEHLPERLSIPGFRSARRWVADGAPGEGKYLATYELDDAAVLQSPRYLSYFQNPTPWTRRCLARCVVFKRWACEQVEPGEADPHPEAESLLLALGKEPSAKPEGLVQLRRFVAVEDQPERIALYELSGPVAARGGRFYRAYR